MDHELEKHAYGIVWKAKYKKRDMYVALKKIFDAFRNKTDAQPSNILIDSGCNAKVCDFGLTRSLARSTGQNDNDMDNPELTEYVATRWYRAPEILLSSTHYTKGVDMWSIGCIMAEMFIGRALFPGTSTLNQLEKIMSVGTKPSREDVECLRSDYGASLLDQPTIVSRRRLEDVVTPVPEQSALDMVKRLLHLNPNKRLNAAQALEHPYVSQFRDPSSEVVMDHVVVPPLDDSVKLDIDEYRSRLYDATTINTTDTSTSNTTATATTAKSTRKVTPTSTISRSRSVVSVSTQHSVQPIPPTKQFPADKNPYTTHLRPTRHVSYENGTKVQEKADSSAPKAEIGVRNLQPHYEPPTNDFQMCRKVQGCGDISIRRSQLVTASTKNTIPPSKSMNSFSKQYDIPMVLRGGGIESKPPIRHKLTGPEIDKGLAAGLDGTRCGVRWHERTRSVSCGRFRRPSQPPQHQQLQTASTIGVSKQTRVHRALIARPWIA
ncbi:hypothetical protein Aperf_G00000055581 [Anoplocephala perfoliata]